MARSDEGGGNRNLRHPKKDGYQSESTIFSESEAWISKVLLLLDDNGYLFPKQMALAPGATTAFDNFCQYLMMWPMQ